MESFKDREYLFSGSLVGISASALKHTDEQTQIEVMHAWFLQNFERPEEHTPYESKEGGYIYIWGGPYDPEEELMREFEDIVSSETIKKISEEFTEISPDWSGKIGGGDLLDYFVQEITDIEFFNNFHSAILEIKKLIEAKVENSAKYILNRLLFANVITALESFLSDAFIKTVLNEDDNFQQFVETTPEFQKEKFPISEIYIQMNGLREKVINYLGNVIWHNIPKVKELYKNTLAIEFPEDLGNLINSIKIRHDIVHRNGKTKDGIEHMITADDLKDLIRNVEPLVQRINTEIGLSKINTNEASNS